MRRDLILHLMAGFFVAILVAAFMGPLWGFFAAVIAGAAKEVRDWVTGKGAPDVMDFLATAFGGILVFGMVML